MDFSSREISSTLIAIFELQREESNDLEVERINERTGVGREGTMAILKKFKKVGFVDYKCEKLGKGEELDVEYLEDIKLIPQKVFEYAVNLLVEQIKMTGKFDKKPASITNNLIKDVKELMKTRFIKKYFFYNLIYPTTQVKSLTDLNDCLTDLLVDSEPLSKSITENKSEYELLLKVSQKVKKFGLYSSRNRIQRELESYFAKATDKKELFSIIEKELDSGLDMVPDKEAIKQMKNKGYSEKETKKIFEELEKNGDAYKPRQGYWKLTGQLPKKWFE